MGFTLPTINVGKFLGDVERTAGQVLESAVSGAVEGAKTRASAVIAGTPAVKAAATSAVQSQLTTALPWILGGALVFVLFMRRGK